MRAIRRKDYVFRDIPTPTDDFPRTSYTTVEHNGPFYPYSDDHKHLAAAARTASRTWTEGGQSAVTPDVYMLAVADKAMELLKYDQIEVHKDIIPETRQEWRDYVKDKILAPVLVLAEQQLPTPVPKSELEAFAMSALDSQYKHGLDAREDFHSRETEPPHDYMEVANRIKLGKPTKFVGTGRSYKFMSSKAARAILDLHKQQDAQEGGAERATDGPEPRRRSSRKRQRSE